MKHIVLTLIGAVLLLVGGFQSHAQVIGAVIVDNRDPGFSASTNWWVGRAPDQYGVDFRYRAVGPYADPATWKADLSTTTTLSVTVSAWWSAGPNRTTSAPYIVYHASGSTTVHVNQQINGGRWNKLGTFTINPGINEVKLTPWTSGSGIIVADAVRWHW